MEGKGEVKGKGWEGGREGGRESGIKRREKPAGKAAEQTSKPAVRPVPNIHYIYTCTHVWPTCPNRCRNPGRDVTGDVALDCLHKWFWESVC